MKITASLLQQFIHCPRQAWLFYYNLKTEHTSEFVKIGKIYHQLRYDEDDEMVELEMDGIKIDKLTWKYIEEFKKANTELEWAKIQVLYYLWKLKQKWVVKKWIIKFKENRKSIKVELSKENEKWLLETIKELENLLKSSQIPKKLENAWKPHKKCKWCSYFEFCWI
jgi:CRISPR-associated exonuclease Cas4